MQHLLLIQILLLKLKKLDTLEVYRLILYDHKYSTSGRLVRVFDNGVVVTKNTEDNTVLSGIDSLFEGTGLVPEYEVTNKGIMLTRLKGLDNVEYIIRIRNDVTGEERSITESIDQEYFNNTNETLFVDYFKLDYTNREEIDVFKSDNFKDVFSWYGKPVRGAKELLKFQVSLTDLVNADEYSQLSWVDPITQEAKVYDLKESNSYIQIVDSKLKEEGFKPVYKVATFLKDGKEFGEAVYLEDVLDKEGNSVMALNGDTGYLIEMVDSMGQRSEPLAEDGVTALGSEEAIAREGDVISLVGLIQGVYDRRETHVDLTLEETEIIAEGDVLE